MDEVSAYLDRIDGQGRFALAVEAIYEAATAPDLWPLALQKIADVLNDVGALILYGRDDGLFGFVQSPGLDESALALQREYDGVDLRAIRGIERGRFLNYGYTTDRDVVSDEEIETHPYYRILANQSLKYFGATPIFQDDRLSTTVSVQRAIGRQPYSDDELKIIERLGKHVEKALRLSLRLINAELLRDGLGEALGRIDIGVFALDSLGRVTFSNPAAQALLGQGFELVDERLRTCGGAAGRAMEQAIVRVMAGEVDHRPILLPRADSNRPLVVYLLPAAASAHPVAQFLTQARVIMLVIDQRPGEAADPAMVRDLLNITLGEARIAALVGCGVAPREAASRLGISEETVRSVLKRVFSKVGVSRQSELTALLTRLTLR